MDQVSELRLRVKQLEAQLIQSQKLHTMGALAGGVAHDFNNLLTAILGHASLLSADLPAGSEAAQALETILNAADRASQLTRQLLNFARPGEPRRESVDLHKTLAEVVALLRHTIDKRIRVEVVPAAPFARVEADPGQMFQVFLNLTLNARDAMPEGGVLRLRTGAENGWVSVCVEDTGHGISPDVQARIFEPFFTTKGPGRGAGMGLPVAQGIVRAHSGRLDVTSQVGRGTTFQVWLPLAPQGGLITAAPVPVSPSKGKGCVLVVDDEEVVRQVASRMLAGLGYRTVEFGTAQEAIEFFRRASSEVDVVLLDLMLPDLSGRDCLVQLRSVRPSVPVILSSGYGVDEHVERLVQSGAATFLQKPYRLAQLSESLAAASRLESD